MPEIDRGKFSTPKALLTHSCTAALEMSALLIDIQSGDEVILPSYTFVSTANAFALRGAKLVFVDIRKDTLNIDETLIEPLITKKTKAIVTVHYAGVACEMDTIMDIANRHKIYVIEDAAQGVNATYNGKFLGTLGHLGCYSFHETKNFISGEGGVLLINDEKLIKKFKENGINSVVIHYSNNSLISNYGHLNHVVNLPLWNSKLAIFRFSI